MKITVHHLVFMLCWLWKSYFYYAFFVKKTNFENICIHYVIRVQHQASSSVSRARGHHLTYRQFEPHSHPTFLSLLFQPRDWLLLPA